MASFIDVQYTKIWTIVKMNLGSKGNYIFYKQYELKKIQVNKKT